MSFPRNSTHFVVIKVGRDRTLGTADRAPMRSALAGVQFAGAVANSIGVLIQPVSFSPFNAFIA
jgi:hypothetical protein